MVHPLRDMARNTLVTEKCPVSHINHYSCKTERSEDMKNFLNTISRIAAVTAIGGSILAGCASTTLTPPVVADSLKVPAGQTLALVTQATGVQIYVCSASKADATKFEWAFKAPEADLFDNAGVKIGRHYGGPTWESQTNGKVVGEVKGRDDGPDATAIPWLLLKAKSNDGKGIFASTQSIQRVNTEGGKAPAAGCAAAETGKELRVPYKASYYFYTAKS